MEQHQQRCDCFAFLWRRRRRRLGAGRAGLLHSSVRDSSESFPESFAAEFNRAFAKGLITDEQKEVLESMAFDWRRGLQSSPSATLTEIHLAHRPGSIASICRSPSVSIPTTPCSGITLSQTSQRSSQLGRRSSSMQSSSPQCRLAEGCARSSIGTVSASALPNVAFVTDVEGNWDYFANYVNMSMALSFTDTPPLADGTMELELKNGWCESLLTFEINPIPPRHRKLELKEGC